MHLVFEKWASLARDPISEIAYPFELDDCLEMYKSALTEFLVAE
jgi:hypothetical protein